MTQDLPEALRRQHAEIERLTAERDALRAQEPVALVVPQARVSWDGSCWRRRDDYFVAHEKASDYERRVGRPLYAAPVPLAVEVTDAARLDFIEQRIRGSSTGVSFDWIPCWDGEPSGYRMMWRRTIHDQRETLREAIDVAMRNGSKA